MRVLVACEFSGVVRDAFAARGHDAWSCDLLPSETPGQHIQDDVRRVLRGGWDLMIAHPPCTYLSRAGARWLYQGGSVDPERLRLGEEAANLFGELLYTGRIPRVAVENPTPLKVFGLPPHTQAIQPYEFGHPYSKRTLLWLRGLPPLMPTNVVDEYKPLMPSNTGKGRAAGQRHHFANRTWKQSVRTFDGIAQAMAEQWG